ncbi:fatty acid desaturase [Aquicoccus sp. SU-CL01552]|uniref:fatty acid desaturase n=1 Tax=Aquicoccus sp. SU-CL01552 TaxID=3127656 RepID=UPI0033401FEC
MDLRAYTRQYARQDNRLAALSYFGTFAVYFASLYLAIAHVAQWYVLIPAGVVHAFSAVRLYVLQHDCGHHSLFETRAQNEWAGHGLSPFTFAPFEVMKQNHNLHHSGIGNLEHRETGEIHTMTLREWNAAGFWTRLQYRLYRNPFILVPLGALFTYFIRYRWPKNTTRFGVRGVLLHNLAVLAWVGLIFALSGWTGLGVYFAFSLLGGMIGVFLVYLQHNFEDTYWDRRPDLDPQLAALQGSSALDFGWAFDLAVACITLHDIHHFNARIPSYRLRACHYNLPPEYAPRRIRFPEAVAALRLKLWDEEAKRLVPFPGRGARLRAQGPRATAG